MTAKDFLFKGKRKYLTGGVATGAGLALGSRALDAVAPKQNYQVELEIEAPWLQDMAKNIQGTAEKKGLELKDAATARLNETLGNVDWQNVIAQNMLAKYKRRLATLAEFASFPYRPGYAPSDKNNPARYTEGQIAAGQYLAPPGETKQRSVILEDQTRAQRKQKGREQSFLNDPLEISSQNIDGTTVKTVKNKQQAFNVAQDRLARTERETRNQANRLDRYRRSLSGDLKDWEIKALETGKIKLPTKEEAAKLTQTLQSPEKQESIQRLRESYRDLKLLRESAKPAKPYVVPGLKDSAKSRRERDILTTAARQDLEKAGAVLDQGMPPIDPKQVTKPPFMRVQLSNPSPDFEVKPRYLDKRTLPAYAPPDVSGWNKERTPLSVQYTPTAPNTTKGTAQDRALAALDRIPAPSLPPAPPSPAQTASRPLNAVAEKATEAAEAGKKAGKKSKKAAGKVREALEDFAKKPKPTRIWNAKSDRGAKQLLGLAAAGSASVLGGLALSSTVNNYRQKRQADRLDRELDKELEMRRQQALLRRRR